MKKSIDKVMSAAHAQVKEFLMKEFEYLYFYVAPDGYLSCWVRTPDGRDGAAIKLKHQINAGQIICHQWDYLHELNEKVKPVHLNPKEFFQCTECGEVKPISEYAEGVMAAAYCKECAQIPNIAELIGQSHERGFYD